jgi:hypothetical protein
MRAQAPRRPGHRAEPCPAPRCTPGHRPCPSAGTHRRGMRHGSVACEARALQRRRAARRDACGAGSREAHLPPPRLQHKMSQDHTVLHTVLVLHSPADRPRTLEQGVRILLRTHLRCWGSVVQARRSLARPAWPRPRSLAPAVHISRCLPACAEARARSLFLPPPSPPPPLSVAAARCGVSLTRRLATRAGRARPRRGFSDGA